MNFKLNLTLYGTLIVLSKLGKTSARLKLSEKQFFILMDLGLEVHVLSFLDEINKYYCLVDWKYPMGDFAERLLALSIHSTWYPTYELNK